MSNLQADKSAITRYLYIHHCGYRNSTSEKDVSRGSVARALGMTDRHFRKICSLIPEVISSHRWGYYLLPLVDMTGEETRVARKVVEGEDRRRMIALYLRQRRRRRAIQDMHDETASEKQMDFLKI